MPSRILKESICTSESLAHLSAEAEVLFYRLIVKVDDFGLYYECKRFYQRSTGRIYRPHNQTIKRKPCPRTDGAFFHIRRKQNEKAQIQTPVLD